MAENIPKDGNFVLLRTQRALKNVSLYDATGKRRCLHADVSHDQLASLDGPYWVVIENDANQLDLQGQGAQLSPDFLAEIAYAQIVGGQLVLRRRSTHNVG